MPEPFHDLYLNSFMRDDYSTARMRVWKELMEAKSTVALMLSVKRYVLSETWQRKGPKGFLNL